MIKLSQAGKMPCKSFSLNAVQTCPGRLLPDGKVKDVCKGCYAIKGMYTFPVVKAVREENLRETYKPDFVLNLIDLIKKENKRFFRWFDSGDVYSDKFLSKIYEICRKTPHVKHWIPTQSRELFNQDTWKKLESLPNVRVRFSSDSTEGVFKQKHGSTVIREIGLFTKDHFSNDNPRHIFTCPSSKQEGKCQACRACWSKKIDVVAYIYH